MSDRTNIRCIFVSDIHGSESRCRSLFQYISNERPDLVFWGGDILPSPFHDLTTNIETLEGFVVGFLLPELEKLRTIMAEEFPRIFLIMGNDDPMTYEGRFMLGEERGLFSYIHNRVAHHGDYLIFGYACVPPTPFQLKDWEKYDVSRYTEVGSVSPEQGFRTITIAGFNPRFETIQKDLSRLAGEADMSNAVFLFHSPPYQTKLDRVALDGKMIDHVPLDVHVGSIAIKRFIENRQPLLTLHGHIHESTRLTGSWRDRIGRTHMFNAAHDGRELAIVKFDLGDPKSAERLLI